MLAEARGQVDVGALVRALRALTHLDGTAVSAGTGALAIEDADWTIGEERSMRALARCLEVLPGRPGDLVLVHSGWVGMAGSQAVDVLVDAVRTGKADLALPLLPSDAPLKWTAPGDDGNWEEVMFTLDPGRVGVALGPCVARLGGLSMYVRLAIEAGYEDPDPAAAVERGGGKVLGLRLNLLESPLNRAGGTPCKTRSPWMT